MIQILDTRINRYVELTPAEANTLNNVRELMLQAITWVKLGRQVNSYFVIARSYRDEFDLKNLIRFNYLTRSIFFLT